MLGAVIELPETIELVSLRTLGGPMGDLVHSGARLNVLALEALAAARHLSAEVCLAEADDNALLRSAAADLESLFELSATEKAVIAQFRQFEYRGLGGPRPPSRDRRRPQW